MEDFVTFNIAKKLKEKGFNEYNDMSYTKIGLVNDTEIYRESNEFYCYAPTIAQVLKWLREEKKLHIRASVYFIGWCVDVTNMDGKRMYGTECEYYNYEQAALAGIEYCLDNLI